MRSACAVISDVMVAPSRSSFFNIHLPCHCPPFFFFAFILNFSFLLFFGTYFILYTLTCAWVVCGVSRERFVRRIFICSRLVCGMCQLFFLHFYFVLISFLFCVRLSCCYRMKGIAVSSDCLTQPVFAIFRHSLLFPLRCLVSSYTRAISIDSRLLLQTNHTAKQVDRSLSWITCLPVPNWYQQMIRRNATYIPDRSAVLRDAAPIIFRLGFSSTMFFRTHNLSGVYTKRRNMLLGLIYQSITSHESGRWERTLLLSLFIIVFGSPFFFLASNGSIQNEENNKDARSCSLSVLLSEVNKDFLARNLVMQSDISPARLENITFDICGGLPHNGSLSVVLLYTTS